MPVPKNVPFGSIQDKLKDVVLTPEMIDPKVHLPLLALPLLQVAVEAPDGLSWGSEVKVTYNHEGAFPRPVFFRYFFGSKPGTPLGKGEVAYQIATSPAFPTPYITASGKVVDVGGLCVLDSAILAGKLKGGPPLQHVPNYLRIRRAAAWSKPVTIAVDKVAG